MSTDPDSGPAEPAPQTKGFPKSVRLLRSSDFRKVYDQGTRFTCPLFAAFCVADAAQVLPRVGFTTPKALGKAVKRNRVKRRVREAVRLDLANLSPEWSIVFNPRRKVLDCTFPELQAEVRRLFIRCGKQTESTKAALAAALSAAALFPSSPDTNA